MLALANHFHCKVKVKNQSLSEMKNTPYFHVNYLLQTFHTIF